MKIVFRIEFVDKLQGRAHPWANHEGAVTSQITLIRTLQDKVVKAV